MGRNKGKNKNRPVHATSKEEVIQRMKEQASASKPALSAEDAMTLEEARNIVADKEKILRDAEQNRDRIQNELEEKKKALLEIEKIYEEKKESWRLNDEAQRIIDSRDQIIGKAKEEAEQVCNQASTQAAAVLEGAKKQEQSLIEDATRKSNDVRNAATQEAESIIADARKQAATEASEILGAAREEEKSIIDSKEQTANLRAASILSRANEYEQRIHRNAEEYEQRIKEEAHLKADAIIADAMTLLEQSKNAIEERSHALDIREVSLSERETAIPEQVEKKTTMLLAAEREAMRKREDELAAIQAQLVEKERALRYQEQIQNQAKIAFEEQVEKCVEERHSDILNELESKRRAANEMSKKNKQLNASLLELTLRAKELNEINGQKLDERDQLREERDQLKETLRAFCDNGITRENIQSIIAQKQENEGLLQKIDSLTAELNHAKYQAAVNSSAAMERDENARHVDAQKKLIQELCEELDKRKSLNREDMLRPIQTIPVVFSEAQAEKDPADLSDEKKWLEHIRTQSEKSGIHFNMRQLLAYHTSLKIGEWAPLVVLSGVSGTGKSELPKQYAIHGGMQFLSVPVKPDWDSPASLFGYYNSIENKFEATELIRALYQMQREKKTPWSDGMLMVLLDEMNLAHPEQYFADLLSKFEESRNSDKDPTYEISLGAGESPEILSVGRNVLWTGTMNEDETTKGLSDKVIDRSMLITFPAPKELYGRSTSKLERPQLKLSHERWETWKSQALYSDSELIAGFMDEKKVAVQKINNAMSDMGRNLGHRVWQSIQNYILNYPLVISAANGHGDMAIAAQQAFCDALAFKMMPKLRGLELQGSNESHIERIRQELNDCAPELSGDFKNACSMSSEIFQWNSAEFMGL